jgi:hypothetical protein
MNTKNIYPPAIALLMAISLISNAQSDGHKRKTDSIITAPKYRRSGGDTNKIAPKYYRLDGDSDKSLHEKYSPKKITDPLIK